MEITIHPDDLRALRERIKPYLKEKRYSHTLEVEEEAARIGAVYLPHKIGKLRISALLHDITKRAPLEKQLQYCEEFGIMLSAGDAASPKVFHAITAAALARRDFADTVDEEIISGIRWHTTGCDRMSLFSAILYLADYIEPTRDFPDVDVLRKACYEDLDKGLLLGLEMSIEEMQRMGNPVHHATVEARDALKG